VILLLDLLLFRLHHRRNLSGRRRVHSVYPHCPSPNGLAVWPMVNVPGVIFLFFFLFQPFFFTVLRQYLSSLRFSFFFFCVLLMSASFYKQHSAVNILFLSESPTFRYIPEY